MWEMKDLLLSVAKKIEKSTRPDRVERDHFVLRRHSLLNTKGAEAQLLEFPREKKRH
jgi:hypothetical protein